MVDALVSCLVERLAKYIEDEVVFLQGVKHEAKWLTDELRNMQSFLEEAEERQYDFDELRRWVHEIRELARDVEDTLDEFDLEFQRKASHEGTSTAKKGVFDGLVSKAKNFFKKGNKVVKLHNMGEEIESFKSRIHDLPRRRQTYQLPHSGYIKRTKDLRTTTPSASEEEVVGFMNEARDLLAKLLDAKETRRCVVAIYAMGGAGKTTLARKLHNHNAVKSNFEIRAWVTASQDYTVRGLLLRIVKSFEIANTVDVKKLEDPEKKDEEELKSYIKQSLQGHRYLVVIDDVWDKKVWPILEKVFPNNNMGSRAIITTRFQKVAENSDVNTTHVHHLRKLTPNESWQLFYKEVSRNLLKDDQLQLLEELGGLPLKELGEASVGTHDDGPLKQLCEQMLAKCGGLPLAIVVLGGLLSTRPPNAWNEVRNNMFKDLKDRADDISCLFGLCFDDLSYQIKHCFLYLSRFPEDYEIHVENLIYLLVAEGFIPEDENHTMEEMAIDYLDELINRSLIQVERLYVGRVATCQVHDLLREFAIEKARDFNFLCIRDEVNHSNISPIISSCPHQAVYFGKESSSWLQKCYPNIRSLFLYQPSEQLVPICSKFRSLRVLDVELSEVDKQKQEMQVEKIGQLIHLRYLGLKWDNISLASSILNLKKLQTLCVKGRVDEPIPLSTEICNLLPELRHLIGDFNCVPFPMDNLTKLQTLKFLSIKSLLQIKTEKLVNLQELWLHDNNTKWEVIPLDSIGNLKTLRRLSIELINGSFGSLEPLSGLHLTDLYLTGKLLELPNNMDELLPNLQHMRLEFLDLNDDPMPLLGKLQKLVSLQLVVFTRRNSCFCKISAKSFPFLEILDTFYYTGARWEIEEGALPRLRGLSMRFVHDPIEKSVKGLTERLRSLPEPDELEFRRRWPNAPQHYWWK